MAQLLVNLVCFVIFLSLSNLTNMKLNSRTYFVCFFLILCTNQIFAQVNLSFPEDNYRFSKKEVPKAHCFVDKYIGSPRIYTIKVVVKEENQTLEEAIEGNEAFYENTTAPISSYNAFPWILPEFPKQKVMAWKVWVTVPREDDSSRYESKVGYFQTPLMVEYFYAGGPKIMIVDTASADLNNFWGYGKVRLGILGEKDPDIPDSELWTPIEFDSLNVHEKSGIAYLRSGTIEIDTSTVITASPSQNSSLPPINVDVNPFRINKEGSQGFVDANLPLFSSEDIPLVLNFTGWSKWEWDFVFGLNYLKDTISYNISGSNINYLPSSFILLDDRNYTYRYWLEGFITNEYLITSKDSSDAKIFFSPSSRQIPEKIDYFPATGREEIPLFTPLKASLHLNDITADFSDSVSHGNLPDYWKGLYIHSFSIYYEYENNSRRLSFQDTLGNYFFVDTTGIHMSVSHEFPDNINPILWPYKSLIDSVQYQIEGKELIKSFLFGKVTVEVISDSLAVPFYSHLENDQLSNPFLLLGNDTVEYSPPFVSPPSNIALDSAILHWYSMADEISYKVDVSLDTFQTFVPGFESLEVYDTLVLITGLEPETNYQYRIRAYSHGNLISQTPNLPLYFISDDKVPLNTVENYKPSIYPNPATTKLFLELPGSFNSEVSIHLIDLTGKKVLFETFLTSPVEAKRVVSVDHLKRGCYILKISNETMESVKKIILK